MHTSCMGSWRSFRKAKKLSKIVIPAIAGAKANPIPADLDDAPGFYLGDTMALALVTRTLYEGDQSWVKDPSDDGRKLRDIAVVVEGWRGKSDETDGRSAKERLHTRMYQEREALATISWLLVGKTFDEIRGMAAPSERQASVPQRVRAPTLDDHYARAQAASPGSVICHYCMAPNSPSLEQVNCQRCGRLLPEPWGER